MTTTIAPITKKKIADLISNREGAKFSKIEMETFQRFILVSSKLRAAEVDGKLVCLWGLIPPTMIADQAYIWFHTTEAAQEHEFLVVRHSQIQVKEMLKEFPRLVGHCDLEPSAVFAGSSGWARCSETTMAAWSRLKL